MDETIPVRCDNCMCVDYLSPEEEARDARENPGPYFCSDRCRKAGEGREALGYLTSWDLDDDASTETQEVKP